MKKILITFLTCLFIVGCTSKDPYIELSYNDFNQMIEEKESFILVIGSSQCTHCADYKLTMEDIVKDYKIKVYYIDTLSLDDKELAKVQNKFSFTGTPTTVFVKEGKEEDPQFNRINGSKDYDAIVKKLQKNGYIK